MYDDNTIEFLSHKSLVDLYLKYSDELSKVYNWFIDNGLSLTVTKTIYLVFLILLYLITCNY